MTWWFVSNEPPLAKVRKFSYENFFCFWLSFVLLHNDFSHPHKGLAQFSLSTMINFLHITKKGGSRIYPRKVSPNNNLRLEGRSVRRQRAFYWRDVIQTSELQGSWNLCISLLREGSDTFYRTLFVGQPGS